MSASLILLLEKYPGTEIVPVEHPVSQETFDAQHQKHTQRQAEGASIGLVWLGDNAIVLARRTGVLHPGWSLLGGTVDFGQTFDGAFVREVEEEAGINATELRVDRLVTVYNKIFIPPHGSGLSLHLAVFEATASEGTLPKETAAAKKEGLEVRVFDPYSPPSPEEMVLNDRENLVRMVNERAHHSRG